MRREGFLVVVACLAGSPDAAAWTCPRSPLSPFQLADRAEEIAIVDASGGAVRVELVLKGTGRPWTSLPSGERPVPGAAPTPPPAAAQRPRRAPGQRGPRRRIILLDIGRCRQDSLREDVQGRVLAFASAEGWAAHPFGTSVVALGPGASLSADEERVLLDELRFWLAHPEPRERRRRLLDLARRPDHVGMLAALHFRAAPELLRGMSRAEAVELAVAIGAALPRLEPEDGAPLVEVLARLHLPEALPALFDLATGPRADAYEDFSPIDRAVGLLVGRDVQAPLANRLDPSTWMRWLAANARATRGELLRESFAAGGRPSIDPEDPRALATVIAEGSGQELRWLALDLCEQQLGRMLRLDDPPSRSWEYAGVGSAYLDGDPLERDAETWTALSRKCAEAVP